MSMYKEVGSLKKGGYVIIDGEPCEVVSVEKSKPGKHGSAKVRLVAIGLFDDVKRDMVAPADKKVEVPIVEKKKAQVVSTTPDSIQIMDLETYNTFEVKPPTDQDLLSKLQPGAEVEYWESMGKVKIVRLL